MCSLISIESGESAEARPREAAASQNTAACIEACRLDELFSDSKFLRAESLIEMVKAMMWAAGPVNRIAASGEDSDTAEVLSLHRSWIFYQSFDARCMILPQCTGWLGASHSGGPPESGQAAAHVASNARHAFGNFGSGARKSSKPSGEESCPGLAEDLSETAALPHRLGTCSAQVHANDSPAGPGSCLGSRSCHSQRGDSAFLLSAPIKSCTCLFFLCIC